MVTNPILKTFYDSGNELWSPIPYNPLFLMTNGFTSRAYNPDAIDLLQTDGMIQEMTSGFPLRIWIEGSGGLADVATDSAAIEARDTFDINISKAANTEIAEGNTRIRLGIRGKWDTETPFSLSLFPDTPKATDIHGLDVAALKRMTFAEQWVVEWARTVLRILPYGPIILEGVVVGAGYTGTPSGSRDEKAQFFVREALLLGQNKWLGYNEIEGLGLPVEPLVSFDTSKVDEFQKKAWNAVSVFLNTDTDCVEGYLLRPLESNDRRRFALYRQFIHPYFRKDISA